jgi:cyanate permease
MLQLGVPNELRGRAMGLYTLAMAGTSPIGALLTGTLTNAFGIRNTLATWGSVCAFAALCALAYKLRIASRTASVPAARLELPELSREQEPTAV